MKNTKNKKFKILFGFLAISIIGLAITYALNTYQTGYKISEGEDNSGKNYQIVKDLPDNYEGTGSCIKITNYMSGSSTAGFFSPTKTKTEWNNFKSWCDTNINNNTTDNNSNCKIEKRIPEEFFHVLDTGGGHSGAPHTDNHSCAIDNNGKLYCWGSNKCDNGGTTCNQATVPSGIFDSGTKAVYLGFEYSMAIDKNGKLHCWGRDHGGTCSNIPSIFTDSNANTKNVAIAPYSACALDNHNNNKIYCWGGYEHSECIATETPPPGFGDNLKFIDAGPYTVCAINKNGNLKCWGEDDGNCNKASDNEDKGQYDINNDSNWNKNMKKIAVGKAFVCGLRNDGKVKCFINKSTEGYPPSTFTNIPSGFDSNVIDIQAGPRSVCALNTSGQIGCWGIDNYGLNSYKVYKVNQSSYEADPNADNSSSAINNRKNNNLSFGMGYYSICTIKTDYSIDCWGLHSPKVDGTQNSTNSNNDNFIPQNFNIHRGVSNVCDESVFGGSSGGGGGTSTYCGDGTIQSPNNNGENEECDDGNTNNGDGCSSTCQNEGGTTSTLERRVNTSKDDAEEDSSGDMDLYSSDLELIKESSKQKVGIRFKNITIPKGATINSAYIQFDVDEVSSGNISLTIKGEDVDDAIEFSSSSSNISNRITTSSSVSWSPNDWNTKHEHGINQRTPDLKNIVSEITNRSGWNSGNDMVFIITGNDNTKRVAESYDGESDAAPLLHIEYSN